MLSALLVLHAGFSSDLAASTPQEPAVPAGHLLGAPLGFTSKHDQTIRVKVPGFSPSPPANLPADLPQPEFHRLVASLDVQTNGQSPILAMSLGLDIVDTTDVDLLSTDFPLESGVLGDGHYPVLRVGDHGWFALMFTVNSGEFGLNPDLSPDIGIAEGRDRSVFSYVIPDSYNQAAPMHLLSLERQSTRVLLPSSLGLPNSDDELHGVDIHMGLYHTDLARYSAIFSRPVPQLPIVFFTLRPDFISAAGAQRIRTAWGLNAQDPVNSATIYQVQWDSTRWTKPTVYLSAFYLGVPASSVIDGLAIDTKLPDSEWYDDEILFSLRHSELAPAPASWQVQHTQPGDANRPPRPAVVRRTQGYGTLGRQLRAGNGIGDFCTADPWLSMFRTYSQADKLLDDFFFARRVLTTQSPQGQFIAPVLAISAFRTLADGSAKACACLSWPATLAGNGSARLWWGKMKNVGDPATAKLDQKSDYLQYSGYPLSFNIDIPIDDSPLMTTGKDNTNLRALAMQWSVSVGEQTYWSPIAALRY